MACLSAVLSCASPTRYPAPEVKDQGACEQRETGIICEATLDASTQVIIGLSQTTLWVVQVKPLPADQLLHGESLGELLIARKRAEDRQIYLAPDHPLQAQAREAYGGDVHAFLSAKADELGYSGSFWQRLSARQASARVRGVISPSQWLRADPLLGTAGNGPQIVFMGIPGLDGAQAGSWTARIAAAHDADWSLGRYLGLGPLAVYLATPEASGQAPTRYDASLGLAGLGAVTCQPGPGASCAWYTFDATAIGGPYARPLRHHPDWTLSDTPRRADAAHHQACVDRQDHQRCWCLDTSTSTPQLRAGVCD